VRSADQFHVGIVVEDFEAALADLSNLFGYEWCLPLRVEIPVMLPSGETEVELVFTYSMTAPRMEVILSVAGTLWTPVPGSGLHHVGYWSDEVAADSVRLAERGHSLEASDARPDGVPLWTFHRSPNGPRIELVSRRLQPGLEQYWASGD
jgi:hypothetical protein